MKDNIDTSYAIAIFSLLKENNNIDKIYLEVKKIREYFEDEELIKFLSSYFVLEKDKYEVIDKVFVNFNKTLIDSIKLIVRKHRINKIKTILLELTRLFNDQFHYLEGIVFTVDKMDKSDIEKLEKSLSKKYKQKVNLINKIDPSLIGGFKILINNNLYDYSLINSLEEMRNKLMR